MSLPFHYATQGEGIPFIFQHGLSANLTQPQSLLSDLSGVKLISIDCPGHGEAPLPEGTMPSFDYYTDRIVAFMEMEQLDQVVMGGISMGAGISINMSLRYPDKVRALVLVRPAWLDEKNPENLMKLKNAGQWIGKENGQLEFEKDPQFLEIQTALPAAAQSILGIFAARQREEFPLVLRAMVGDRPFTDLSLLANIEVPCLIMGNEDDPLHPYEMAVQLHQHINDSELALIVSRYINNEQHKISVNQLISTFINQL